MRQIIRLLVLAALSILAAASRQITKDTLHSDGRVVGHAVPERIFRRALTEYFFNNQLIGHKLPPSPERPTTVPTYAPPPPYYTPSPSYSPPVYNSPPPAYSSPPPAYSSPPPYY